MIAQAEKTSEQKPEEPSALPEAEPAEDQGGIHLEAGKATETNPERDTVMAEELTGDLPATQIKSENKVQTRASKAGPQKVGTARLQYFQIVLHLTFWKPLSLRL